MSIETAPGDFSAPLSGWKDLARGAAGALRLPGTAVLGLWRAAGRARARRRAADFLHGQDDARLADIGLARDEIDRAVWTGERG